MTATATALRVLVVEDSDDDAHTITSALHASGAEVEVAVVRRLDQALPALSGDRFDAVLLDLTLPDSAGLETVVDLCGQAPDLPVVVVTHNTDSALPARSLRAGAEDYVVKSELSPPVLLRAVTHAIERHRRTTDTLHHAQALRTPTSSGPVADTPLTAREPALFEQLSTSYADALEVAVDRAPYRNPRHGHSLLAGLAERLGAVNASPRDVIDLHMIAIERSYRQVHPDRAAAYVDEGRVALIELLGRLATFYRERLLRAGNGTDRDTGSGTADGGRAADDGSDPGRGDGH